VILTKINHAVKQKAAIRHALGHGWASPLFEKVFSPLLIPGKDNDDSMDSVKGRQITSGQKRNGWSIGCRPPKQNETEKNQNDSRRDNEKDSEHRSELR
jgi:hypothetical protein